MASTYDITMKQYNGTDYDTLYPTADLVNNVVGVLQTANGGTGQSSLNDLKNALLNLDMGEITAGYYIGTGTYGSSNRTTISGMGSGFSAVRCVIIIGGSNLAVATYNSPSAPVYNGSNTTAPGYTLNVTFDNTGISWYNANSAVVQMNASGTTYYWVAFSVGSGEFPTN